MNKAKDVLNLWETRGRSFKVGDVVHIKGGQFNVDKYAVVVISKGKDDFYVIESDKKGKVGQAGRNASDGISHSNMWFDETITKVGTARLKEQKYKKYKWVLTGDKRYDREKLPSLDARWMLFADMAPKEAMTEYDELTDVNHHSEAAVVVARFANHVIAGEDPDIFIT